MDNFQILTPPGIGKSLFSLALTIIICTMVLNVHAQAQRPGVVIKEIQVKGSTVFSDRELKKITDPYVNHPLTDEIIEEIRHVLTLNYIKRGYVNSGAVIPDQIADKGKIVFHIIEGRVSQVDIIDNKWFSKKYIEGRLFLETDRPLNVESLQKRLQQLQQDHRIAHIQAELKPGINLGDSLMNVRVEERNPFQVQLGFNNYQVPAVGSEQWMANITHQNLTGHGDIFHVNGLLSEENNTQIDVWYLFPVTVRDTTLTMRYRKSDFDVTEGIFEDLDISSESEVYQITLRHPFYRTLTQEFVLALSGENNRSRTYLLGEPFSFSQGAENGKSVNTVLRFSQEWTYRTQKQVAALRSQFSLGINELDATIHDNGLPDGDFFSWLGQFQWAKKFNILDTQLLFRADLQLASDSLLGLEQIDVGGRYTVRGYRENQLVRDQAFITSLEARVPLIQDKGWTEYLQLAAFFDFGEAWNKSLETPSPDHISSIGLGLRWSGCLLKTPFEIRPQIEIYWGIPLRDIDTPGGNLQDDGIHFQFLVQNF
jgi:hemolysin activation/secretion protein